MIQTTLLNLKQHAEQTRPNKQIRYFKLIQYIVPVTSSISDLYKILQFSLFLNSHSYLIIIPCQSLLVFSSNISINIDIIQKLYSVSVKRYYHFRNLNYMVYNYSVRLDIQQLTAEQQKEPIKNLNILKNIKIYRHLEYTDLKDIDSNNNNE